MSQTLAEPIARLIEEFGKLPGIGPKTAQRLTFYLLRQPAEEAHELAQAIVDVKEQIILCGDLLQPQRHRPCQFCADPGATAPRSASSRSRWTSWRSTAPAPSAALYHVLHGSFSPMEGVLEDDLKIRELVERVRAGGVEEVILATNATVEGEATANLIRLRLRSLGVRLTRLAQGLPIGSDLEYADDYTLSRALEGRRDY